MFRLKLTVDPTWLERVRALPERAQRNVRRKIQTELVPELQSDVETILADAPGPVASPFQFGSTKSQHYWFAMIRANPNLTDGSHWIRTGLLEGSWVVSASDRLRMTQITVSNILRESTGTEPFPAKFVYGPFAPPGHIATGWPALLENARQALHAKMLNRVYQLWGESLKEGVKGQG